MCTDTEFSATGDSVGCRSAGLPMNKMFGADKLRRVVRCLTKLLECPTRGLSAPRSILWIGWTATASAEPRRGSLGTLRHADNTLPSTTRVGLRNRRRAGAGDTRARTRGSGTWRIVASGKFRRTPGCQPAPRRRCRQSKAPAVRHGTHQHAAPVHVVEVDGRLSRQEEQAGGCQQPQRRQGAQRP